MCRTVCRNPSTHLSYRLLTGPVYANLVSTRARIPMGKTGLLSLHPIVLEEPEYVEIAMKVLEDQHSRGNRPSAIEDYLWDQISNADKGKLKYHHASMMLGMHKEYEKHFADLMDKFRDPEGVYGLKKEMGLAELNPQYNYSGGKSSFQVWCDICQLIQGSNDNYDILRRKLGDASRLWKASKAGAVARSGNGNKRAVIAVGPVPQSPRTLKPSDNLLETTNETTNKKAENKNKGVSFFSPDISEEESRGRGIGRGTVRGRASTPAVNKRRSDSTESEYRPESSTDSSSFG